MVLPLKCPFTSPFITDSLVLLFLVLPSHTESRSLDGCSPIAGTSNMAWRPARTIRSTLKQPPAIVRCHFCLSHFPLLLAVGSCLLITALLAQGSSVELCGWVKNLRKMKKVCCSLVPVGVNFFRRHFWICMMALFLAGFKQCCQAP